MFPRRVTLALPLWGRFFSSKSTHDLTSLISELNKEMESVFGEPPPTSLASSLNNQSTAQDSHFVSSDMTEMPHTSGDTSPASSVKNQSMAQDFHFVSPKITGLTHTGSRGEAQMVDVSPKENSNRVAIASCKVFLGRNVYDLVSANQMTKGDVLSVAKIAGISGAKQTSNLIPLCHNINLSHVRVDLTLNPSNFSVEIEGEAASTGKTGVEMEAMTAVTVTGLTVYDMCKAASKDISITDVRLEHKTGGKSGEWSREK